MADTNGITTNKTTIEHPPIQRTVASTTTALLLAHHSSSVTTCQDSVLVTQVEAVKRKEEIRNRIAYEGSFSVSTVKSAVQKTSAVVESGFV